LRPFAPARGTPRRQRRGDPVAGAQSHGLGFGVPGLPRLKAGVARDTKPWIPAVSAFTRVFDALCAGMNGVRCYCWRSPSRKRQRERMRACTHKRRHWPNVRSWGLTGHAGTAGMTRITQSGHRPRRNPAAQRASPYRVILRPGRGSAQSDSEHSHGALSQATRRSRGAQYRDFRGRSDRGISSRQSEPTHGQRAQSLRRDGAGVALFGIHPAARGFEAPAALGQCLQLGWPGSCQWTAGIAMWIIVSTMREVFGSSEELIWPEKIVCGHSDHEDAPITATPARS